MRPLRPLKVLRAPCARFARAPCLYLSLSQALPARWPRSFPPFSSHGSRFARARGRHFADAPCARPPAFGWPGPHGAALHSPAQPSPRRPPPRDHGRCAPPGAGGCGARAASEEVRRSGRRSDRGCGAAVPSGRGGDAAAPSASSPRPRGAAAASAPHRSSQPSGGPARPGERREERPELGLRGPAAPVTLRNDLPGHRRGRAAAGPKCRRGGGRSSERPYCWRGSVSL